jgi:hypothetical protein
VCVLRDVHYAALFCRKRNKRVEFQIGARSLAELVSPTQEREINKFVLCVCPLFLTLWLLNHACKIRRKIEFNRALWKAVRAAPTHQRTHTHTITAQKVLLMLSAKSAFTQIEDGVYDDGARTPRVNSDSGYESSTSFLGTCHVFVCEKLLNFGRLYNFVQLLLLC